MATLCASLGAPPSTAIQIQSAIASLPSPPASILPTAQAVNCSAPNPLPLIAPTPPTTPISSGSSVIPAQLGILNTAPTGTVTPQNSIFSTSHSAKQNSTKGSIFHSGALKDCEKLREAYINAVMPIDRDIDNKWNLNVRGPLDKILDDIVQTRGVNQELMYAAPRKFRKPRDSDFKPTIVVSVADAQDRKRVKRRIKELKWLEEKIHDCQLKLMVVIDPVKLQSRGQAVQGTTSAISHETSLAAYTSTAWLCGRQIILLQPSEMTGEYTCTLGGVLVVDSKLYGLTAGHAFFSNPNPTTSSESRPSSSSDSIRIINESLDDLRNPFVFDEEDTDSMGPHTDEDSASLASSLTGNQSEEVDTPSRVPGTKPDEWPGISLPCTVVAPAAPSHSPRVARNCDWALVELPQSGLVEANAYYDRGLGVEHRVSGSKTTLERPSGDVAVIFSPNNVVHGHLSPNSASHGVGPYLFDVRLVVLQEEIREYYRFQESRGNKLTDAEPGCSGAWVVQDGLLCGYIIAARANRRWLYMIPIQKVYEDIRDTLEVQEVRVATGQDIANSILRPGPVRDLLHAKEDSTRANTQQSSSGFLSQAQPLVAAVIEPSVESSNEKGGSQIRPADADVITRSAQEPDLAQQRSLFPQMGGRPRSISSQENQPGPAQNPARASADVERGTAMDDQDPELLARRRNGHSKMSPKATTVPIDVIILAFQAIGKIFWYIICLCSMRQAKRSKKAERVKWKGTITPVGPMRTIEPIRTIAPTAAPVAEMQGSTQSVLPAAYYSSVAFSNHESHPFRQPRAPDLAHLRNPPSHAAAAYTPPSASAAATQPRRSLSANHYRQHYRGYTGPEIPSDVDHYVNKHRTQPPAELDGDFRSVSDVSIVLSWHEPEREQVHEMPAHEVSGTLLPGIPRSDAFNQWVTINAPPMPAYHTPALSASSR